MIEYSSFVVEVISLCLPQSYVFHMCLVAGTPLQRSDVSMETMASITADPTPTLQPQLASLW